MIFFCERDGGGKIKGLYANRQPGYAEEAIDDGHPDVAAFRNPPPPPPPVDTIIKLIDGLEAEGVVNKAKADALKARQRV